MYKTNGKNNAWENLETERGQHGSEKILRYGVKQRNEKNHLKTNSKIHKGQWKEKC